LRLNFQGRLSPLTRTKAIVAEEALKAGAHLVNDVWGLRADPAWRRWWHVTTFPVVLMHNRSKPANAEVQAQLGGRYIGVEYQDLIADVKAELMESVQGARAAGIPDQHIILDPGIGFGKTVEQIWRCSTASMKSALWGFLFCWGLHVNPLLVIR